MSRQSTMYFDNLVVAGSLTVIGETSTQETIGTLTVTGTATVATLSVTGAATVGTTLGVTGISTFSAAVNASAPITVSSASATALAVGLAGATNPAFVVDASTASQAAGFKVTGAASNGTVALAVVSSNAAAGLTINAKGTGTIVIGTGSTGNTQVGSVVFTSAGAVSAITTLATTGTACIGGAASTAFGVRVLSTTSGAASQYGGRFDPTFGSDGTTTMGGVYITPNTTAATYETTNVRTLWLGGISKGSGHTINAAAALYIDAVTVGNTSNHAIFTNAGLVHFAGAVDASSTLAVTGASTFNSAVNTFAAMPTSSAGLTAGMLYSSADGAGTKVICIV